MKKTVLSFLGGVIATTALVSGCANTADQQVKPDFAQVIPTLEAITADWNKGDLDKFVTVYDSAATFMLPTGPIGVEQMKTYYQEAFTETGTPTSMLRFDSLEMKPLGSTHALVTGKYILTNQDSTEQSGRYTLVFVHEGGRWKIMHDHSN